MYMDENDVRSPRDRVDGELLRRLLEESHADGRVRSNSGGVTRGCDGSLRTNPSCSGRSGDYHVMPRRENAAVGNENNGCGCGCGEHTHSGCNDPREIGNTYPCGENGVHERALAMVYAPVQHWRNAYDPKTALSRGTLFRELDMPFHGKSSAKGGNCRGY